MEAKHITKGDAMKIETADRNLMFGTGFKGYVEASRAQLEHVFGAPVVNGAGDKVTTMWVLVIDGVVATIYDYKLERVPGMHEILDWHVGGKKAQAVDLVRAALALA